MDSVLPAIDQAGGIKEIDPLLTDACFCEPGANLLPASARKLNSPHKGNMKAT
jgi:hypothetical protein